jgi:hypothetical protein
VKLQSCSASNGEFAGGFAFREANVSFRETDRKFGRTILPDAPNFSAALAQLARGVPLRTGRLKVRVLHAVPISSALVAQSEEAADLKSVECQCNSDREHPRVAQASAGGHQEARSSNLRQCRCTAVREANSLILGIWFAGLGKPTSATRTNFYFLECRPDKRALWPSAKTLFAKQCVPLWGMWSMSTAFRHFQKFPACSSKRTVRLMSGVALDECRAWERYPARRLSRLSFSPRVTFTSSVVLDASDSPMSSSREEQRFEVNPFRSRSPTKRHDVENVVSAGASAAVSTIYFHWLASIKVMQRTFNP